MGAAPSLYLLLDYTAFHHPTLYSPPSLSVWGLTGDFRWRRLGEEEEEEKEESRRGEGTGEGG